MTVLKETQPAIPNSGLMVRFDNEIPERLAKFIEVMADSYSTLPAFGETSSEHILNFLSGEVFKKLTVHPSGFLTSELEAASGTDGVEASPLRMMTSAATLQRRHLRILFLPDKPNRLRYACEHGYKFAFGPFLH